MKKKDGNDNSRPLRPTGVELEILDVLWKLGPSAMGRIHEACAAALQSCASERSSICSMMSRSALSADQLKASSLAFWRVIDSVRTN